MKKLIRASRESDIRKEDFGDYVASYLHDTLLKIYPTGVIGDIKDVKVSMNSPRYPNNVRLWIDIGLLVGDMDINTVEFFVCGVSKNDSTIDTIEWGDYDITIEYPIDSLIEGEMFEYAKQNHYDSIEELFTRDLLTNMCNKYLKKIRKHTPKKYMNTEGVIQYIQDENLIGWAVTYTNDTTDLVEQEFRDYAKDLIMEKIRKDLPTSKYSLHKLETFLESALEPYGQGWEDEE